MKGFTRIRIHGASVGLVTILLTACGGGGGGGTTSPTPAPPPPPSPPSATAAEIDPVSVKTLRFTWPDVSDATHYRLLENPDNSSGFAQVGSDVAQGVGVIDHVIPLYARLNAQYILQSCNTAGCTDSSAMGITKSLTPAIGYVKASNADADDRFGHAVSLSADGRTLAISARTEDSGTTGVDGNQSDNSAPLSGAVYVFVRVGNVWSQQAYLKASNTETLEQFGLVVSLSADGNTLAVGSPGENSNASGIDGDQSDNSAGNSGAVYVFSRSGDVWSQQVYVKASNTDSGDQFGMAVGLSADGNTLAVGASLESSGATGIDGNQGDNSVSESGAVYVFGRTGDVWSQDAYVKASNPDSGDRFGIALGLSADGNTLAVGASSEESNATGVGGDQGDNSLIAPGAVYVFNRAANVWSQQAYVKASNTDSLDQFGRVVDLSADGNTMAVSARNESSGDPGIDGNQNDNDSDAAGAVYVFNRSGSNWLQQAYLKASNVDVGDLFGRAISLSEDGDTLAVSASREDSSAIGIDGVQGDNSAVDSGAVYVFERDGSAWFQQAYVKANNPDDVDVFGSSVSLSGNGETLAVGAEGEASLAGGINGDQDDNSANRSGAAYLY